MTRNSTDATPPAEGISTSANVAVNLSEQLLHEEQLLRYGEIGGWMAEEWSEDLHRIDSPWFASYAALQRGIGHERGYADWCAWVVEQLEKGVAGESSGTGRSGRA